MGATLFIYTLDKTPRLQDVGQCKANKVDVVQEEASVVPSNGNVRKQMEPRPEVGARLGLTRTVCPVV